MSKQFPYMGEGRSIIYCSECGKIIGVNYNANERQELQHDCFCVECHNDSTQEQKEVS